MGAYTCEYGVVHKVCRCPTPHTIKCDKVMEHAPKAVVPEGVKPDYLFALDLAGVNIGRPIVYLHPSGEWRETDDITMITHKKNGRVLVRYGKNNRQIDLDPLTTWKFFREEETGSADA